tara:strand:+ start:76 stop:483 length:408 start_codon:yes stop_codon:yes gene_type:complete
MKRRMQTTLIAAIGVLLLSCASGSLRADEKVAPDIKLTIDYGDGVQKTFTQLAWHEGMTVLDLMDSARNHPRGIQFVQQGTGATVFLKSFDDVQNEGGRGNNWIFWRNEVLGDRSIGVQQLQKGDRVLWKFGKYR